ncbi:hypothetical protein DMUE_0279 [Dictyocoela muelleri]|nr:hypothetical protein DMUE_0279 [Dictyocoela muelleri]
MNFDIIKKICTYTVIVTITVCSVISVILLANERSLINKIYDMIYNNTNSDYSSLRYNSPSALSYSDNNTLNTVNENLTEYVTDKIQNFVNPNESKRDFCDLIIGTEYYFLKQKFEYVKEIFRRFYDMDDKNYYKKGIIRLDNDEMYDFEKNNSGIITFCRKIFLNF